MEKSYKFRIYPNNIQIQQIEQTFGNCRFIYNVNWYGKQLVKIDTFYPSSKMCSCCGYKLENLTLDVREWDCPNCNTHLDRDVNAAINILNEGLRILE